MCGRNAVQITVAGQASLNLSEVARRLRAAGLSDVATNPYLLRATLDGLEVTLFPDARAIIKGTQDERAARTVYSKYVGV